MSRQRAAIELPFGDGDHTFRLGLAEIEELEASCDMSVFLLHAAVSADLPFAKLKHLTETIRLGLIGGGMVPVSALMLVKRYVEERPLHESVAIAGAILRAAIERVHTSDLGDPSGEAEAPGSSVSTSAPSTETPS
ncbi:gene transfer agent family protein [Aquamicrobium soli]|uniref:Gene transfer agent family protein n=1 Tax=Aquamicrobium soli TaxID=1811518 RepID=A0ABV7KIF5_9HYPH